MALGVTDKRAYNWSVISSNTISHLTDSVTRYISLVAAACMVLYGYDASVYNSVQGSKHWVEWFDNPGSETIGSINSVYTVGAIIGGWFIGGPISDYFGRKAGMGVGCVMVIIATFMQAFSPWHGLGTFIGGRVVVGLGQGVALSEKSSTNMF